MPLALWPKMEFFGIIAFVEDPVYFANLRSHFSCDVEGFLALYSSCAEFATPHRDLVVDYLQYKRQLIDKEIADFEAELERIDMAYMQQDAGMPSGLSGPSSTPADSGS